MFLELEVVVLGQEGGFERRIKYKFLTHLSLTLF